MKPALLRTFFALCLCGACSLPSGPPAADAGARPKVTAPPLEPPRQPRRACAVQKPPPLKVIHFFDWYHPKLQKQYPINGRKWTHKVDWRKYGLTDAEVGSSRRYYDVQLELIAGLHVDGLAYQYADTSDAATLPPALIASLRAHRMKMGAFFDWEILNNHSRPELSQRPYIRPEVAVAKEAVDVIASFYGRLPRDLWLLDRDGRVAIPVFGFGFDRENLDAAAWDAFWRALLGGIETALGHKPVLYWTASNQPGLEYAFQHFPAQVRALNFVLDTPRTQLGPGAVTWNFNFDNLGVQREHQMRRVVRDDPRYLQEMRWLAQRTAPDLLFIYSWNEFFEGSSLMPDLTYGTSKYELARALLRELDRDHAAELPCTLLIVDDLSAGWKTRDWHAVIEEEFTLYPLRRLVPQADVRLADEAPTNSWLATSLWSCSPSRPRRCKPRRAPSARAASSSSAPRRAR